VNGIPQVDGTSAGRTVTGPQTLRGVMNIFPKDIGRGEDGKDTFNPGVRAVIYPSAPIARKNGDRRAPLRAVEFNMAPDEFFAVQRYTERHGAAPTAVGVGSFTDYNDAYAALIDRVPAGQRAEIRIMVPTRTEVFATGRNGEEVIIGESLTWQPQPIADRLRLTDAGR
jgi:hypothetical protein